MKECKNVTSKKAIEDIRSVNGTMKIDLPLEKSHAFLYSMAMVKLGDNR